jgi:hypothetical protein
LHHEVALDAVPEAPTLRRRRCGSSNRERKEGKKSGAHVGGQAEERIEAERVKGECSPRFV